MKRNILALITLAAIIGFSACKPREKCPAYGKQTVKQQQHRS
jgi:hypothetical protein